MKKVYISPFVILLLVFSLKLKCFNEYIFILFVALLHELSHLILAKILGYKVHLFKIMPYGACLEIENGITNSSDELLISSAGPFLNFILLIFCIIIKYWYNIDTSFCAYTNLYMMVINLIPILPLDGGRIFNCITKDFFSTDYRRLNSFMGVMISILIVLSGFVLAINTNGNVSLMVTGFFMMNHIVNINERSYDLCKLYYEKKDYYIPKIIALDQDLQLYDCMRHIKTNRLLIIYIIDNEKNVKGMISNIQVIKTITEGNYDLTLKDFLN